MSVKCEALGNRLLAVGDIHGCLDKLETLMGRVDPTENDLVIFLGDYIDRGLESPKVVEFLIGFAKTVPTVFLRGNHEDMLLKYIEQGDDTYLLNGGRETLHQYKKSIWGGIPSHHLEFFELTLPYYQTDEFIFVHAGLRPEIRLEDQLNEDLFWLRDDFLKSDYCWGKTIVYGHTPVKKPRFCDNRIALDTGAVFSVESGFGKLTCCEVQSRNHWQVIY